MSEEVFWGVVLLMSCATYGSRTLPFFFKENHRLLVWLGGENARMAALGPSLIAAIAAVTIVPDFVHAASAPNNTSEIAVYMIGLAVVIVLTKLTKNSGLAVLAAMAAYGVARFLFGL